jgi:putative resolvase
MSKFVTCKKACEYFGITTGTLQRWANYGVINTVNVGKNRRCRWYDIGSFGNDELLKNPTNAEEVKDFEKTENKPRKEKFCYCRVSSHKQKDDLDRQAEFMREKYPKHSIIKDVGSGLNFKRRGLLLLLTKAIEGNIKEVVVAHRDRLCRFGFELIEWLFEKYNVKLVVLDTKIQCLSEQEMCRDICSIVQVYSCRINGRRRYKKGINESKEKEDEIRKEETKEESDSDKKM